MQRPVLSQYEDLAAFVAAMLAYRKKTERSFSVLAACKKLRRVSPTLVSLIVQKKREVTTDRVEEFSKLLGLTPTERQYLKDRVARDRGESSDSLLDSSKQVPETRKQTTLALLSDWVNVYVKDAFQLRSVRRDVRNIYAALSGIASQKRVDDAVKFLLRAGYIRRNIQGQMIEEVALHAIDQRVPSEKIRNFHKAALKIATRAIDEYPPQERYANAMTIALDQDGYDELRGIIEECAERMQKFAESHTSGERLYQVVVNLSPTGGACE